jgi:hypothetical protein
LLIPVRNIARQKVARSQTSPAGHDLRLRSAVLMIATHQVHKRSTAFCQRFTALKLQRELHMVAPKGIKFAVGNKGGGRPSQFTF